MAKRIKLSGSATNCIWAFFFGVALVCLLFFSSQTQAAVGDWEQLGPWGGDRFRIYVAPEDNQKLYVVGNSIHRSLDGGETWTNLENPSSSVSAMLVYSLAMDPTDTQTLYVGTLLNGVWKTTSGGDTWNQINNGIPNDDQIIRSVLVDASNPNTVYASTSKYNVYSDTRGGVPDKNVIRAVYRSIDAGATWEPFDTGIPGTPAITALFQDPFTLDIFAATYEYGIYKYDSILNIWTAKNTGLSAPEGFFVTHLAFDPNIQNTILATTQKDWVYKSEDGGGTWNRLDFTEPLDQPYPPMAYHAVIDPNNSNVIWLSAFPGGNNQDESPFYHANADQDKGGLFLSLDGGESWSRQQWLDAVPNAGPFGITLDPTETITRDDLGATLSSNFYAASGGVFGIMKSVNGGQNFEKKTEGLIGFIIDGFCQHPDDNSNVYATSEGALHISFDSALSWSTLLPTAQEGIQYLWDVNVDPDNQNTLYYAIGEPAWDCPEHKGLYRVDLFELNPQDSFHDGPGDQILSTAGIGIWQIYTQPNSTIYLATQTNGVLKSIDAGANWQDMNAGLENASVTCLAFDSMLEPLFAGVRQNDGTKYPPWWEFDEPGGVYKWNDLSLSWTRIGEDLIQCAVFSVKISPDNPNTIFVAGIDGIFVSEDGGATWEKKDRGLPCYDETFVASDIAIDPNHTNRIFVSSFYLGIWASTDGGNHWFNFSNNLNRLSIQNLFFDSGSGLNLYAASQGASIYRCNMQLGEAPVLDSLTVNGEPYSEPYQISMKELETVEIHIEAHDPDGKDLTYEAMFDLAPVPAPGEDPESAFTFDPGAHIFRFTPPLTSARPGQPYKLEFLISNGVLGTWVTIEITVLPLSPPKIDLVTANGVDLTEPYHVTLKELETVEIQIQASDDDGDVLTYQAWLDGAPVPAPGEDPNSTFTFDPATRIFEWTPPVTSGRLDAYTLSITVEDGVFITLAEVGITVLPLSPPKIDLVTANGVDLTEPYHVTLKELETVEIQIQASDDDGDVLTYQAWLDGAPVPAPGEDPNSTFTFDPATRIFEWTPPVTSGRLDQPYHLYLLIFDGVFPPLWVIVDIQVNPVISPGISLAINQELFHPGDELRIDMTLRNEFSPAFVDLYLAFGTPDCPLTTFIPSDRPLASGIYLWHGLMLEDIPIIRYTFPSLLTKSALLNFSDFKGLPGATRDLAGSFSLSLTYTMILVPAGEDVMDPEKWLSSDTVQFDYEIP